MTMIGARPMFQMDAPDVALPRGTAPAKPKVNWMGVLADALSGAAGRPGQYAASMQQQRQEQSAFERGEQQYQRRRLDDRDEWQYRQENERRAPTGYAAQLVAENIDPQSPEGQAALRAHRTRSDDPFITVPTPQGVYSGPRSDFLARFGGGATPAASTNGPAAWADPLAPQGGQSQPATGNFRRPY